jgi:hypothetical protein
MSRILAFHLWMSGSLNVTNGESLASASREAIDSLGSGNGAPHHSKKIWKYFNGACEEEDARNDCTG